MSKLHLLQPVDLQRYYSRTDGTLLYDQGVVDRETHCYFAAPMDFQGYLRFQRVLAKEPNTNTGAALAYPQRAATLEVDCFAHGVKVFVRIGTGQDRTLKVFAEDSDGMTKLVQYEREL